MGVLCGSEVYESWCNCSFSNIKKYFYGDKIVKICVCSSYSNDDVLEESVGCKIFGCW